jgi:hypothetical protein
MNPISFIRAFARAVAEERRAAHRRWLRRNKVILPQPKPDGRSSLEIHHRILARQ